jgi:hypothetical protein
MYIYISKRLTSQYQKLDDGKILTGNPIKFDGKNQKVSGVDFPKKTNP